MLLLTLATALRAGGDGALIVSSSWDKLAFRRGFLNRVELAAQEVACPALPVDLRGTYFRNGFARFTQWDGAAVRHPFNADGMVCAVSLDGSRGTAVVRQRYVATSGEMAERRAGRSLFPGVFGGALPVWKALFPKIVANTGVCWHGGRLFALWEGSRPYRLDPISLATIGECDVDGLVGKGPMDSFSAHPCAIPRGGGGMANFAYFGDPLTGQTRLRFWQLEADSFDLSVPVQTYNLPGYGM
jgi:all-trans-8'-apo-beta-carotenal 15,15'-oxygenase